MRDINESDKSIPVNNLEWFIIVQHSNTKSNYVANCIVLFVVAYEASSWEWHLIALHSGLQTLWTSENEYIYITVWFILAN